ncbi:MAG: hypothetical protein VYB00_04495 [Candidatus Thermoplasmatota archaeon]|nr:hypothetical protein [Candidatus Thermoplasmatota archaeon]
MVDYAKNYTLNPLDSIMTCVAILGVVFIAGFVLVSSAYNRKMT